MNMEKKTDMMVKADKKSSALKQPRISVPGLFLLALCFVASIASPVLSAEDIAIGTMKMTLMPEYDSTSVLVIQEGKFLNKEAFPRDAIFLLPPGVTKLTDACSLSPGGQHFCQLFEIKGGAERNILNVKLPYPDFFIDFQYAPFKAAKNSERSFTYRVESNYDVKNLVVVIQVPYRSERFKIEPATEKEFEKEGYHYYKYVFSDVKKDEPKNFHISYFKADDSPSVDTKFSPMAGTHIFSDYTAAAILVAGAAGIGALLFLRRRKQEKKDVQP